MKSNVGKTDKIIRIILGVLIGAAGVIFKSWWGLLAIIPLFTGIVGWCGIYKVFGISTAKKED
jgi:hypothetical protein